jgi:sarcosine oxidase
VTGRGFDSVVIGLGAMGAATLLQLARLGQRVIGLDRYDPPHDQGSTHGETRITRCAIGEGEIYVPLALRSHAIWREIEQETGEDLLTQCGALILAGSGSTAPVHGKADFLGATIAAARRFAIPHEVLDADCVMRRFPQFRLRGDETGYFEPGGGFLRPERCVAAQLMLARRHGAEIRTNTQVTAIVPDGAGVCITIGDGQRIFAAEAVLAAGAWSPGLIGRELAPRMAVLRQVLHWFAPARPAEFAPEQFPVFIWAHGNSADDSFYGFPVPQGGTGVKLAREQYHAVLDDPDLTERHVSEAEAAAMFHDHVQSRLPGLLPPVLRSKTCLYTMTSDGDFLIGRPADNPRLLLVSACSGHGFKHSAGLGEKVARSLVADDGALAAFAPARIEVTSGVSFTSSVS